MKSITKKRTKAFLIDLAISTAVTAGVEYVLRKKVKNEAIHAIVTPTAVMWSLEFAQLHKNGQTVGYNKMGIALENKNGTKLTSAQILKRMAYRDSISSFDYLKNPTAFEQQNGQLLPHDLFSDTVVKEV
ncbi:RDD family protein [Lysinibacillus sphaericus]|uniref:RDD family protein n=1 Tax=Lysinibacillus sphaericus TaxID=1421 RepID=UPI0018CF4318|nr:RDD family protein [Lysinibacillus sphaericus]MBG9453069.1 RDD family protein [Lysinibacillus sphaericus]MBG9477638.1 RDD family protein [Lysinibacillus sphaericus]MBG9594335.1 RDD family protein [Lysinibacillus sphaericus]